MRPIAASTSSQGRDLARTDQVGLGHGVEAGEIIGHGWTVDRTRKRRRPPTRVGGVRGAVDRARTGDLNLGKVALYQLSYYRKDQRV